MKRVFVFSLLSILLLFASSCKRNNVIVVNNLLKSSYDANFQYSINLPKTNREEIDNFLENDIMSLVKKVQLYETSIVGEYETYSSKDSLNFFFTIQVLNNNQVKREFIRTYNFNISNNKIIYLNDTILLDVYLPILNNQLEKINLNIYDLPLIKYIINTNDIIFFIPKEVSKTELIKVTTPNYGYFFSELKEKEVEVDENKRKLVALTFDDGPTNKTIELVDFLNNYNIKATFFLIGDNVSKYPNATKYIYENNYELGNHSFHHSDFTFTSISETFKEIDETQEIIYSVTKSYPRLFRFPYGKYNNMSLTYINFPIILWNVDSNDWANIEDERVVDNVLNNLQENSVILFHDRIRFRKKALDIIIKYLIDNDYEFVTVSQLFKFSQEENIIYGKIYY